MNEINFLKDPQQAEERFRLVAFVSGIPWKPSERAAEKDGEEPLA